MATTSPNLVVRDEPTYTRSVFEAILKGMGEDDPYKVRFLCTDMGVLIRELDMAESLDWHPLCEVAKPGGLNPLDEPWLPFPFTARQLAALMADGWGHFIRSRYGEWEDGPDEESMASIGVLGAQAKVALRAAFAAYRDAVDLAPRLDRTLDTKAQALWAQYNEAREAAMVREEVREHRNTEAEYSARLARVNDAVAVLEQPMRDARQAAATAYAEWRRAVVEHLLLPIEEVSTESFRSDQLRSAPVSRRAEVLHGMRSQREFEDTPAGRAHWALAAEAVDVEREISYWRQFNAKDITEAGRRKDELKELNTRLAELEARMSAIADGADIDQPRTDLTKESTAQRQKRRLDDLRALGGEWIRAGDSWRARDRQSGAFGKLVQQEKANGSPNCSDKSVRRDLCAAAEAEADRKRSGAMLKGLAP